MARSYGTTAQLLAKVESVYGTQAAGNYNKLPFISCDLGSEQPLLPDDTIGNGRDPLAPSQDVITVAGDIEVPVDLRDIGVWLRGLLGTAIITGAGPYTHTWKTGATALPSLSIEVGHNAVPRYFMNLGCLINSLMMSFSPQGTTKAKLGILAQGETNAASSGGGTPTTRTFKRFSQFLGTVKRNAVSLANITAAELNYSNNADAVRVIRSDGKIEGVDPTLASMTGNITARFADMTLLDDATAGTAIALELAYTFSASEKLTITAPKVYLPKPKLVVNGPGGIEASFDWQAAYDTGILAMASVVLVNDLSAAY